jgi:5-(carboxyamino)imidazole ribonucleotide mutase
MTSPQIGIVMGSDSDLPVMAAAIAVCERFAVPHEVRFLSAHRTPLDMVAYAQTSVERGLKVLVAGAGGAAHLPGMVAALTPLPVIGVPVPSTHLQGVDSLYSIVQMPKGIPVATVAIGNAENAGLLAVQILASCDPDLRQKVVAYRQHQADTVHTKQVRLAAMGYQDYLRQMG